ncbi:MAG: hypothetical protein ABI461_18580 [Polyangiaceae bacterium]
MLAPVAILLAARKYSPRTLSRMRGVGRVSLYLGALTVLAASLTVHGAKAEMAENQMSLGRDLAPLADLLKEESTISVNGERAHVSTTTTKDSLETVVDRFAANCAANASPLADGWKAVPQENREEARLAITAVATTHEIHGDEGTVACVARGAKSENSFLDAMRTFTKTGDFGAIGQMRYVYARRAADGTTFVMTAWTDDSFSIRALTPRNGEDAPGSDSALAPRPEHAQRILATAVEGAPFAVRAYKSADAPKAVLSFYDASLTKSGWSCAAPQSLESAMLSCAKDGVTVTVSAQANDGSTLVSLSEMR